MIICIILGQQEKSKLFHISTHHVYAWGALDTVLLIFNNLIAFFVWTDNL
jgi:hypothetical protein